MNVKDLKFLFETRTFSGEHLEATIKEVLFILRWNRTTQLLPVDQVEVGNSFILAAFHLSLMRQIDTDITVEDVGYILEENTYLNMGDRRN